MAGWGVFKDTHIVDGVANMMWVKVANAVVVTERDNQFQLLYD